MLTDLCQEIVKQSAHFEYNMLTRKPVSVTWNEKVILNTLRHANANRFMPGGGQQPDGGGVQRPRRQRGE